MSAARPASEVLILYYSRFGVLKDLAEAIAEGVLQEPGADVHLLEIGDDPIDMPRPGEDEQAVALRRAPLLGRLTAADALIVGAPSYFGSMASPIKRFFEDCLTASNPPQHDRSRPWYAERFRDKVGAAFTASATAHGGNEQGLHSILTLMMHLGMITVTPGQGAPILANDAAPYGATVIAGAEGNRLARPPELAAARDLGQRVARVTDWLRLGRTAWEQQRPQAAAGRRA
ncbi:MAG TPA: NAD(P)H-dependent oxidoreductase [Dehalococcoidia bacterium]|nr:NAD(P)H-dependent oxidoreductase [Dehalococcoidia bacterium]